jgi:membrane protein YdbS with pleckstrin-like domain
MDNRQSTTTGGIGFFGALTIAFIILKLMNVISWSWLWVLSPIWISIGIVFVLVLIPFILFLIGCSIEIYRARKK